MGLVMEKAMIVKGNYAVNRIADDPTDDMFLRCAMEGGADYLVSRDPHLRNIRQFHGVKIIDVKTLAKKVRNG